MIELLRELVPNSDGMTDATVIGAAYALKLITAKEYVEIASDIVCEEVPA